MYFTHTSTCNRPMFMSFSLCCLDVAVIKNYIFQDKHQTVMLNTYVNIYHCYQHDKHKH